MRSMTVPGAGIHPDKEILSTSLLARCGVVQPSEAAQHHYHVSKARLCSNTNARGHIADRCGGRMRQSHRSRRDPNTSR